VFFPLPGQFWKSRGRDIPRLVTTHLLNITVEVNYLII